MNSTCELGDDAARALKPYPAYKDSGVEWLGDVPAHWEVLRLKQICRLAYGDALADAVRRDGAVSVFGSNGRVGFHDSANTRAPCIVIGRKGSFGKVNYSPDPAFAIDTTFFVDSRFSSANIRWLFFLLRWLRLDEVTRDSAVPGLDREDTYQRPGVLPPLSEQAAIVRFLNHADRRIRRYIRAQQQLVMLLEEQKQAITHRAVTRGLDPNVRLKPSGVEWLGDVPEHWRLPRLGALLRERGETNGDGQVSEVLSVLRERGVIPYAEKGNIGNKKSEDITRYKVVRPDDIVVNCMNVIIGSVGLSRYTGCLSPVYYVLTRRSERDYPRYLNAYFQTKPFQESLVRIGNGILAHRMRIPMELLKCEPFPRPPFEEQAAIVSFLDRATADLDAATTSAQREISLLREYHTRFIADVVTGKLDVRAAAAGLPDEVKEPEPFDETSALIDGEEEPSDDLDAVPEEAEEV